MAAWVQERFNLKTLLNLINDQLNINKMYLYSKDAHEARYQYLIKKRENFSLKHYNDPKTFIEYSNDMQVFIKILM